MEKGVVYMSSCEIGGCTKGELYKRGVVSFMKGGGKKGAVMK